MKDWMTRRSALLAVALAIAGCGRGSQPSPEAAAPAAQQAAAAQAVTEYPRPPKPSKPYRIGVAIPHLANPHYVGQAHRVFGWTPHGDQVLAGVVMLVEQIATLGTCCAILLWPHLKRAPLRDESVQL